MTAADTDKDGLLSIAEFKMLDLQALAWFGGAIASGGGGLAMGGLILSTTGAFFIVGGGMGCSDLASKLKEAEQRRLGRLEIVELALNNDGLRGSRPGKAARMHVDSWSVHPTARAALPSSTPPGATLNPVLVGAEGGDSRCTLHRRSPGRNSSTLIRPDEDIRTGWGFVGHGLVFGIATQAHMLSVKAWLDLNGVSLLLWR